MRRSSAIPPPPPLASTSTKASGATPLRCAQAPASASNVTMPSETKLCSSFMLWPALTGPTCVMFSAKQDNSGRQVSSNAASPPTSRFSRPSAASLGVRVMGASRKRPPAAATACAMRCVDAGKAVEQSMTTVPGRKPCNNPGWPVSTASTAGEPVSTRMITSDREARAARSSITCAPAAFSSSSGWLPGWSNKATSQPLRTRLLAMPCPISPMPTMPTVFMSISLLQGPPQAQPGTGPKARDGTQGLAGTADRRPTDSARNLRTFHP